VKIPRELIEQIKGRHAQGQSDRSIATWLGSLDPPIQVGEDAVRKIRKRTTEPDKVSPVTPPANVDGGAVTPEPAKPSGAANRRRQAEERAREAGQHAERGSVVLAIPFDADPMRSHLYELRVQLELQRQVAADTIMTLPDKVRYCTQIGQTIARLRVDAEIEAEQEEIRRERAVELAEMQRLEKELEREKKELGALRRQLEKQLGERN
jgi:hypothetical protein